MAADLPVARFTVVGAPTRPWERSYGWAKHSYWEACLDPTGRYVIATEFGGNTMIWDAASGRRLHRLDGELAAYELDDVRRVEIRPYPDGRRVLVEVTILDCSDVAWVWDLETGAQLPGYEYPDIPRWFLSEDRALTRHNLVLTVWDLARGAPRFSLTRRAWWDLLAVSDDVVVARDDATLELWRLAAGETKPRWSADGAAAAVLPDGAVLVRTAVALEVRAADDGALRQRWPAPTAAPQHLAVAPSGTVAVIGLDADQLAVIELATGEVRARIPAPVPLTNRSLMLAIGADARHLLITFEHGCAEAWDLTSGRRRLRSDGEAWIAPDGASAYTLEGAVVRRWRLGDEEVIAALPPGPVRAHSDVLAVDVAAKRRRRVVRNDKALELWRVEPPLRLHTFRTRTVVRCAALDPLRRWLLSGQDDGALLCWDTRARRHLRSFDDAHAGRIDAIAISPDGERAASAGADAVVRGWRVDEDGVHATEARWDGDDRAETLTWADRDTLVLTGRHGRVVLAWRD